MALNLETPVKSTVLYKSVVGYGKAYLVEDRQEKIKALNVLMQHYSGGKVHGNFEKSLDAVQVIKIVVDTMTGKSNPGPRKM